MKNPIRIVYAYDGLIYLPLLLAQQMGLLPLNVVLELEEGDEQATQKLMTDPGVKFAVCDPFYLREVNNAGRGINWQTPEISVIGCLINKPPFWIYTSDRNIRHIRSLKQLFLVENIRKVGSYAHPNTGYLYGKDLVKGFEKVKRFDVERSDIELDPRSDIKGSAREIQVTANIVKVAAANDDEIIYRYPVAKDAAGDYAYLHDIFFTGILARNEFLEENMPDCIKILDGVRKAIKMINDSHPDLANETNFPFFKKQLKKYKPLEEFNDAQLRDIRGKILYELQMGKIYSHDLDFTKRQWKKMDALRNFYQHDHKRLHYYTYVNKRVINALNLQLSPNRNFFRRVRESQALFKLTKFFSARLTEWSMIICITVAGITIETIDRGKTLKYLVWDLIGFLMVGLFIFYAIRENVAKRLYNEKTEIPEPVIFILRAIVLGFLGYNLKEVISH